MQLKCKKDFIIEYIHYFTFGRMYKVVLTSNNKPICSKQSDNKRVWLLNSDSGLCYIDIDTYFITQEDIRDDRIDNILE